MLKSPQLDSLCIAPDLPLMEAIEILTAGGKKIALVVDENKRLLGVVTDYDVRIAILNHIEFVEPVSKLMQRNPVTAPSTAGGDEIITILSDAHVSQLPIIEEDGTLVDIKFIEDYQHMREHYDECVAVIMAGGLGTRLHPATEHIPKPLLEVNGQPILFILIDQLLSDKFSKIYVTLNYLSEMIISSINAVPRYRGKVEFVVEEKAQGTAGSLTLLPIRPTAPFFVINGDLITNISFRDMLTFHCNERNMVTLATKRYSRELPYGVAEIEGTQVVALREKPSFNYFINTGVYVVDPKVLECIEDGVMVDMTEIVQRLLNAEERIGSFAVHEYWIDIGTHDKYKQAQKDYPIHFSNMEK